MNILRHVWQNQPGVAHMFPWPRWTWSPVLYPWWPPEEPQTKKPNWTCPSSKTDFVFVPHRHSDFSTLDWALWKAIWSVGRNFFYRFQFLIWKFEPSYLGKLFRMRIFLWCIFQCFVNFYQSKKSLQTKWIDESFHISNESVFSTMSCICQCFVNFLDKKSLFDFWYNLKQFCIFALKAIYPT